MTLFVFSLLCAFLQVSDQNPTNQWTMMPHVLVVVMDGTLDQQPLSCLEQPEKLLRRDNKDGDISWRKNGEEEGQRGNVYLLDLKNSFAGGNYTCHSKDGSLLNHTEVLIQDDETTSKRIIVKTGQGDHLYCSAQNYNGEFHCSWTWQSRRVGQVAFLKARRISDDDDGQCSLDESGRLWTCSSGQSNFGCSVDDSGHRILCLDQQHCPYAEESQHIYVTVYMKSGYLVESYSKHFYMSEIVKPDKVAITKVNTTMIEWTYPSSWSSPYSYFPLTFQIAQFRERCKKCDKQCTDSKAIKTSTVHSTCQFKVKHRVKAVCIRAKDVLCNSQWSDWSFIRSVLPSGKKKRQQNK
uniref:Interleukin-12 subunit beta n=1 Tax=Cyclopterus lumpus TaxID=8103 RepID=A0A8C3GAT2_CYCLU